jgi:hypothetical protein
MKGRLAKVLFGDDLAEADSAYIFEMGTGRQAVSDLRPEQIIVAGDEADTHAADMAELVG